MKRIAGTFMLLAGLSGCITFTGPNQPEKKAETRAFATTPAATTLAQAAPPAVPPPAASNWDVDPGHVKNGSYVGDYTVQRPAPPYPQPIYGAPPQPPAPQQPQPLPPAPVAANPAPPTTPFPGLQQAPLPPLLPVVNSPAPANNSLPVMAGMPVVITPRGEQSPTPTRQVSFSQEESRPAPATGPRIESRSPSPSASASAASNKTWIMPEPPSLKGVPPGDLKVAKAGVPIVRMVNTKRITLNFEVKDVGSSGLGSVELWYTQDCREWKKYEAPTKAKAYVVEVDDEGMYGFTLLARSGIGLSKEPPAKGDQPQVWVIVDLTKPDVHLTEVTPTLSPKMQHVSIKWKATDKNLGRQPITLYYAEKEEGPWKVMASNLENTGHYQWPVPADAPAKFVVRAEATDLAGNIGQAQLTKPVLLDTRVPTVSILNVEANNSK